MNSLAIRILTGFITFMVGVAVATALVFNHKSPQIAPVNLSNNDRTLEMVFVLDTTGSMGGLIDGAKQRIWGIVNNVMREQHASVRPEWRTPLSQHRVVKRAQRELSVLLFLVVAA